MSENKAWIDDLPPVLRIVLADRPASPNLTDLHRHLKSMLPELRRQALWTIENQDSVYVEHQKAPPQGFLINPVSGLDPFSRHGKCLDVECRIKTAEEIARTVGLYADCAVIGDPFSDHVLLAERWSKEDTMRFFTNLMVFTRVAPLYKARVFRFANNYVFWCKAHLFEFESLVDKVVEHVDGELEPQIQIETRENQFVIHTNGILGTPYLHVIPQTARGKREFRKGQATETGRRLFRDTLHAEIRETLFNMRRSTHLGAITFSNSRASLLAARRFETDHTIAKQDIEVWEASRSVPFPWIGRITPEQVVALRQDAHRALPRFREKVASSLSGASGVDAPKLAAQLREEAAEVEAELNALDRGGEGRFRAVSSALAMTISVYGFAGEFIPVGAALTGLLSVLGLLHVAQHKERQEIAKLASKPGYVLVRAKELAEHAGNPKGQTPFPKGH